MRVERGGTETYQDVAKHLGIEVDLLALRQLLTLFSTLHTHTVKHTCSAHRTHTGSGHRNFTSSFGHIVRSPMRDIYVHTRYSAPVQHTVHTYKVQHTCSAHVHTYKVQCTCSAHVHTRYTKTTMSKWRNMVRKQVCRHSSGRMYSLTQVYTTSLMYLGSSMYTLYRTHVHTHTNIYHTCTLI